MKKLTSLLLATVMLFTALTLSGCGESGERKYILTATLDRGYGISQMDMIATSDVKEFKKDDVTFNLSYAMHSVCDGESSLETKKYGDSYYIDHYDVTYGLYITTEENAIKDYDDMETSDLEAIESYYFIKMIPEQDALTDKYLRTSPRFAYGYGAGEFNHNEKVTIPREFLEEESGDFCVILVAFAFYEESNVYHAFASIRVKFDYVEIDEDTIYLDMNDWEFFRIM